MVFSIIIPVYNVEKYLRECLNSVLGQTFPNWEVICVNDGSTDSSASILEVFATKDNRVRIVTQPNSGLSAARNVGLKHASGEYILFLDSDDWLEVNALEILANDLCDEDMVCFVDYATENEWWAEDVEGVNLYDDVGLVMFDWFTAEIYDDQIVNVTNYSENFVYEMRGVN